MIRSAASRIATRVLEVAEPTRRAGGMAPRLSPLNRWSRIDGAEEVVEVAPEHPPDIHAVVHHELLELGERELALRQGRTEVARGLVVDARRRRAADADDPAVAAGEMAVPGPDLAVEEVEVGP